MEKCGLLSILRSVFPKDEAYERTLCHILHDILKDGSHISCDNFIRKFFASYVFNDVPIASPHLDTRFFALLGDDKVKMSFFKAFVSYMQRYPDLLPLSKWTDQTVRGKILHDIINTIAQPLLS